MRLVQAIAASLLLLMAGAVGASAQSPGKIYRVGLLFVGPMGSSILGPAIPRFFAKRGFVPGKNLMLEKMPAGGHLDRLPKLVAKLVADKVQVIITAGYPAALAAKKYDHGIPVVVVGAGNPVATGLAASLVHPGGDLTGISEESTTLSAKRLEILKEALPQLNTVAVLWNADDPAMTLRYQSTLIEGKKLGIKIVPLGVRAPHDFRGAFAALVAHPPDAMLMVLDALTSGYSRHIFAFATAHRLPVIYEQAWLVQDGGLMSYGPNMKSEFDRVVDLAVRILKGAKPANLPLELPTRFTFAVNLKTAKALGLTIPDDVMMRADDVVE
ncbi:MAG: ABC transporter substrate-binding protein [Stellaceae bacterium]